MSQSKILNLKKKAPKPNPLIEIMGPIDIGKTSIAKLVAKRLQGTYIAFPVLDPFSITGRALLSSLTQNPRGLEVNSNWWAHIYSANLYENHYRIQEALELGPVIVTNYTSSFKFWMKTLELPVITYVDKLTQPDYMYILLGDEIVPTNRPKIDFSPEFILRINRHIANIKLPRFKRIQFNDFYSPTMHNHVNNIATAISSDINSIFKCPVNEKELYTKDHFIKKKDIK